MVRVREHDCEMAASCLVNRWQLKIQRLCYRLSGRWEEAEDITQEVFSRLVETRDRYRPTARFSTFLWSIALNQCRDWLRRQRRRERLIERAKEHESNGSHCDDRYREEACDRVQRCFCG